LILPTPLDLAYAARILEDGGDVWRERGGLRLEISSADPTPLLRFAQTTNCGYVRGPYRKLTDRPEICRCPWICECTTLEWRYTYAVYITSDVQAIIGMLWPFLLSVRIREQWERATWPEQRFSVMESERARRTLASHPRRFVVRNDKRTGQRIGSTKEAA